ncbi:hypothetical protein WN51_03192 [Melipona quadrifasciata]|uniref:Uncharacterized protein n=1 Tax=Melipona quadrifasciata TaxID=166423 RepID=A0A0M8ZVD6_9HYME|nr:hypothetical protein WN51_03192 [Melipona quadrifasciata]
MVNASNEEKHDNTYIMFCYRKHFDIPLICRVRKLGHSLWSVNQLLAQEVKRKRETQSMQFKDRETTKKLILHRTNYMHSRTVARNLVSRFSPCGCRRQRTAAYNELMQVGKP